MSDQKSYTPGVKGWLRDQGVLLVVGTVCLLTIFVYVFFVLPKSNNHAGYVMAKVLRTSEASSDADYSLFVEIELPDGTRHSVGTNSHAFADDAIKEVCLEKRVHESGASIYQIAALSNCIAT